MHCHTKKRFVCSLHCVIIMPKNTEWLRWFQMDLYIYGWYMWLYLTGLKSCAPIIASFLFFYSQGNKNRNTSCFEIWILGLKFPSPSWISNYSPPIFAFMASSFKTKVGDSVHPARKNFSALKLVPLVRTEQDLKAFRATIALVVPADIILRRCDRVRASITSRKK